MIHLTRGIQQPHHHIRLNAGFQKDIAMWKTFLQSWNGVNLFLEQNITFSDNIQLFTDASGSIGYGGFLNGAWFQGKWEPHQQISKTCGISHHLARTFPYSHC